MVKFYHRVFYLFLLTFSFHAASLHAQTQIGQNLDGPHLDGQFGQEVDISNDGSRIIIGDQADNGTPADGDGVAYVYENISGTWTLVGSPFISTQSGEALGWSVSMSADGNVVAISSPRHDSGGVFSIGRVQVFEWDGVNWNQRGSSIFGDDSGQLLGYSISLSDDGNTIAVGAPNGIAAVEKYARVFRFDGTDWVQLGTDLLGQGTEEGFGSEVELSSNGNIVAIGDPQNNNAGTNAGTVRVFSWDGTSWTQLGNDLNGQNANDRAGRGLSMSASGTRVAVGHYTSSDAFLNGGKVRVFDFDGSDWVQVGTNILATHTMDATGVGLSLSDLGDILVIGESGDPVSGPNAGSLKHFIFDGIDWMEQCQIIGLDENNFWGQDVELSAAGSFAVVGAPGASVIENSAGQVRVFDLSACDGTCDLGTGLTVESTGTTNGMDNGEITICLQNAIDPINIDITSSTGTQGTLTLVEGECLYNYEITGLPNGTYDITISDGTACSEVIPTIQIEDVPCTGFKLEEAVGNPSTCAGSNSGYVEIKFLDFGDATSITVDLGNGIPPMEFTELESPLIFPDLPPGSYDVAVFDNNGCEVTYLFGPVFISESEPVSVSAIDINNVTSVGDTDGSVEICTEGGNGNFTPTIQPEAGTISEGAGTCPGNFVITDLPIGDYTIYSTDSNGCLDSVFVTINDPSCNLSIIAATPTDIDCGGAETGEIEVTILGGVAPYVFSTDGGMTLSPPQASTSFNQTGLPSGEFDIQVVDANGCSVHLGVPVTIEENEPLSFNDELVTNVSTLGGSDGMYNVCIKGGIEDYDLTISPDVGNIEMGSPTCSNGFTITDLPEGDYVVTVTDDLGCTSTSEFTVLAPNCLGFVVDVAATMADSVSCFGENDGSITVTVTGGASPYTYNLSGADPVVSTDPFYTFTGLQPGDYTLVVESGSTCIAPYPDTLLIGEPAPLATQFEVVKPCAGDNNGIICLIPLPDDGDKPYTYTVEKEDAEYPVVEGGHPECETGTFHVPNVDKGDYWIQLVNGKGCIAQGKLSVAEIVILIEGMVTQACAGQNVGAIDTEIALGENPPFDYQWDSGPNTPDLENLEAGGYSLTVTDARGCTGNAFFNVENDELDFNIVALATCPEQPAGALIVNTDEVVEFSWSTGIVNLNGELTDLNVGNYQVTLTDSRGCTAEGSGEVPEYNISTEMFQMETCTGGSNGSASVIASNGIGTLDYIWSNGGLDTDITDLQAGPYTVTVTDINNCTAVSTIEVLTYDLDILLSATDVCEGANTGQIEVTSVTNGSDPLAFAWSGGESGPFISGVGTGDYTVTVVDGLGCIASATATINQFPSPSVNAGEDVTIEEGDITPLNATPSGGTEPYTFGWFNGPVDNPTGQGTNASPGETTDYVVIVTDANGCTASDEVRVEVLPEAKVTMPTAFSPNGDSNNDLFEPFEISDNVATFTTFRVFDRWGVMLHDDPTVGWNGKYNDTDQPVGTYVYIVVFEDLLGRETELKGHFNLIR